jgi:hypothetical protein
VRRLQRGSGEVTAALVAAGVSLDRIDACDPYTVKRRGFEGRWQWVSRRWVSRPNIDA